MSFETAAYALLWERPSWLMKRLTHSSVDKMLFVDASSFPENSFVFGLKLASTNAFLLTNPEILKDNSAPNTDLLQATLYSLQRVERLSCQQSQCTTPF